MRHGNVPRGALAAPEAYTGPVPDNCPRCGGRRLFQEEFRDGTDHVCLYCGYRLLTFRRSAFWQRVRQVERQAELDELLTGVE